MKNNFIHLHNHSHYSIQDGVNTPYEIIEYSKNKNMNCIAFTEHGNMNSTGELMLDYRKDSSFKVIFGCEFYINENPEPEFKKRENQHILILAKNQDGINFLFELLYKAGKYGFYYKPRIHPNWLFEGNGFGNIIITTACINGFIPKMILNNEIEKGEIWLNKFSNYFGKDFYLELQFNELEEQKKLNNYLLDYNLKNNISLITTNDCHYCKSEDFEIQKQLLKLQSYNKKSEEKVWEFDVKELYLKTRTEIEETVERLNYKIDSKKLEESFENTLEVEEKCEFINKIDSSPKFYIPKEFIELDRKNYLRQICLEKLNEKIENKSEKEREVYKDRLEYELQVLFKLNFEDYFLTVFHLISNIRKLGIRIGVGRGSSAGSLICFLLDVNEVDPIKYNLIFERFINPERIDYPDIDLDFSDKDKVIKWLLEEFGEGNIVFVSTFSKFSFRSLFRDLCRINGIDIKITQKIMRSLEKTFEKEDKVSLETAFTNKEFRDLIEKHSFLKEYLIKLSGKFRHLGKHASGVIIYPEIYKKIAVNWIQGKLQTGYSEGLNRRTLGDLGFVKFDILGLNILNVINETLNLIEINEGIIKVNLENEININNLDLDNKKVYEEIIYKGYFEQIFQLESEGIRNLILDIKPKNFNELVACVSLYRPGAKNNIPKYKENRKSNIKSEFSFLDETYGVFIYQEQIIRYLNKICGLSYSEADKFRKIGSKYSSLKIRNDLKEVNPELFQEINLFIIKIKGSFFDNFKSQEKTLEEIETLWEDLIKFLDYSFNKSHAICYSYYTFLSAYLKFKYPIYFYCSLLNNITFDKYEEVVNEMQNRGFKVLFANINESENKFKVKDVKTLICGFSNIKNIGEMASLEIIKIRDRIKKWNNLDEFLLTKINWRVVNKRVLFALAEAGVFNSLGCSINYAKSIITIKFLLKNSLMGSDLFSTVRPISNILEMYLNKNWNLKLYEIENKEERDLTIEILNNTNLKEEKIKLINDLRNLYGFDLINHFNFLLGKEKITELINSGIKLELNNEKKISGDYLIKINSLMIRKDKNNGEMAFIGIEDFKKNKMNITCFNSSFENCKKYIKIGEIVLCNLKLNTYKEKQNFILNKIILMK